MKEYYKVVTENLQSAIMNPRQGMWTKAKEDFCIQYKVNEWIKPNKPGSKIMIFSNFEDAFNFKMLCPNPFLRIYKCHAKNPTKKGFITEISRVAEKYEKLYRLIKQKKRVTHFYAIEKFKKGWIPKGTLFCSAIKLIECV